MSKVELPLFPLNTVMFPGGVLPLRIFEARYLDMIGNCMKNNTGFGICLLQNGRESGVAAKVHKFGTIAKIVDWDGLPDGLLGVTAQSEHKIHILETRVRQDQLVIGEVEILVDAIEQPLPEEFQPLSDLLRRIIREVGQPYTGLVEFYQQAGWVSGRLTELLPLQMNLKQRLLEIDDHVVRLHHLRDAMVNMQYLKKAN